METTAAAMPEEGSSVVEQQQQQQQQSHTPPPPAHHHQDNVLIRTSMDDSPEDYGPLKKKHKYRDEQRDKERSGSISFNGNTAALSTDDTSITLDSSLQSERAALHAPAAVAGLGDAPSNVVVDVQEQHELQGDRVQDQAAEHSSSSSQQQQQRHSTTEQEQDKPRDLAGSPGSVSEKTRKHNFYVPSREVAFLLDSVTADASSAHDIPSFPSRASTTSSVIAPNNENAHSMSNVTNGSDVTNNNAPPLDAAQINANALLATGMPITGRQAAKIAAMEAKEKARLAKEKELEEARAKKKAELERKKAEAARRKAEKEALAAANIGSNAAAAATQNAIGNSSVSTASVQHQHGVPAPAIPANATVPPPKATAAPKKRAPASRKGNAKATSSVKQDSPEVPVLHATLEPASPTSDIKVTSPSIPVPSQVGGAQVNHIPSTSSKQQSTTPATNDISLPPMPEPEIDPLTGFIPYASEGARAAALAKAAKQKAHGGAGSPPSSSIPVPNVKNGGGKANGRKGSTGAGANNGSGSPLAMQQLLSAAGAGGATPPGSAAIGSSSQGTTGGKKGRSSTSGNTGNNAKTKAQALAAAAAASSAANYSGRASPTNALEHAAAAIDAVLDAGALARAQAQAEEEEVDDRLYCICQKLYDPERLMIACDRCDNWYHADCINIDETQINLIDLFICPICEKDSDLHTVSKARCARKECGEAALKLSKYCSDRCGILVAASKLEQEKLLPTQDSNSTSLNLLWDAVSSVKKLETVIRSVEDDLAENAGGSTNNLLELDETTTNIQNGGHPTGTPNTFSLQARANEEQQRLEKLQTNLADYVTRRQALEDSLALANARLTYFNYAKGRWKLSWIDKALQKPSTTNKKAKSSKSGGGTAGGGEDGDKIAVPPDAPCGFDVRLVWDDKDWQEWLESDEGRKIMDVAEELSNAGPNADPAQYIRLDQGEVTGTGADEDNDEEGLVCTLSKKKCDRHAAWQKLRQADFDVDKATLERQLDLLTESERRIRRRVEDIQDFLRRANGKLSSMSSNAATPLPNGDGGNVEAEDEEVKEEQEDVEMEA